MSDNRQNDNAAWRAAQQWRERVQQTRPHQGTGGLRLLFTWLLFGVMLIIGTLLGLFFLVIGWAMLPLLRHRMKKRAEQVRASQAQYAARMPAIPIRLGAPSVCSMVNMKSKTIVDDVPSSPQDTKIF